MLFSCFGGRVFYKYQLSQLVDSIFQVFHILVDYISGLRQLSTHTIIFAFLKDHHPSLPDAQCFSYISSYFSSISHGMVNAATVTPSCLEAEVAKVYLFVIASNSVF